MHIWKLLLICSFFAVVVCPTGYTLKDGKCFKKPNKPKVRYTVVLHPIPSKIKPEVSK